MQLKPIGIQKRILSAMLGTALLAFVVFGLGEMIYQSSQIKPRAQRSLESCAGLISISTGVAIEFGDSDRVQEILSSLQLTNAQILRADIIRSDGPLATYPTNCPPLDQSVWHRTNEFQFYQDSAELCKSLPTSDAAKPVYLVIRMSLEDLKKNQRTALAEISLAAGLILFVISLMQYLLMKNWVLLPLTQLAAIAERAGKQGDYGVRMPPHYRDEFGQLGQSFNSLLTAVETDITNRKLAEAQLHLQSTVLGAAANAIIITDPRGNIEWVNPAFSKLSGYSVSEVVGQNPRLFRSRQHPPEFYGNMWATITAGAVWHGDLINLHKDGRSIIEDTTITPVRNAAGAIAHFVAIKQDITNYKQTERLLGFIAREGWSGPEDDFMARLVQYIGRTLGVDYVFIGRLKDAGTIQTSGFYAKGKLVADIEYARHGTPCDQVIGNELRHYDSHLQEMFPADACLVKMDAHSYLGIPLMDSAGRSMGLMAAMHTKPMPDIQLATAMLQVGAVRVAGEIERQAKVDELRWKTALLEAQMEAAPEGILMVDTQGKRILQNQRLNELLKIPPEISANEDDRVQLSFVASRAKDPGKMKDHAAYVDAHPEEIIRDELEFVDGTIVERYSSPVRDKSGRNYGRIWTFRDITQARQLEAQLRQSQKMEAIGQLAGGVAHDFNNILSSLMMQTDLIEMAEFVPAEIAEGMVQIRADATRAAQLTRQLLLFSRRQVMQTCLLDLNGVVTNLAKMLQRIIGEDVRLHLNLHAVPLMTRIDAGMVEQMLMNLAVNARDAMPKGGRLSIETSEKIVTEEVSLHPDARPGRYVCFSVSDTGTGIPPEILPQIFEPFFTTKEAGKGTGLGLATVFGIVKSHQGWLKVENNPGQGVTFRIFLPASPITAAEAAQTEDKPKPKGGKETILLVEDEAGVRKTIHALLERHGYDVVAAANGIEALDLYLAHTRKVALVLTDLVMPGGMTGHELGRQLQSRQSNLKIIFMSGYSPEIAGRQLELRPGENFIQKPFAANRLLETIRRGIDE